MGGPLRILEAAKKPAAHAADHFVALVACDVQSSRDAAALSDRRSLASLLAEWQDAGARGLERIGRRSFPRVPAAGGWSGRASCGTLALGVERIGHGRVCHHASLHPGLDRRCAVEGGADEDARRSSEADAGCPHGRLLLVWRRTVRRRLLRDTASGRRPQPGVSAGARDESATAPGRLWSSTATAGREPTRIQDGQVDRTD